MWHHPAEPIIERPPSVPSRALQTLPSSMSSASNATKFPPNGSSAAHTFLHNRRTSVPRLRNRSRTLSHSVPPITPSRARSASLSTTRPVLETNNTSKPERNEQQNNAPRSRLDRASTKIGQFANLDRALDKSNDPNEPDVNVLNQPDDHNPNSTITDSTVTPNASNVESAYVTTRVSRTGFMERSVAGGMISAARNARRRTAGTGSAATKPAHHRLHGGFGNPWPSALKDGGMRSRGGSGSRTFFHKVAKDRRPPEEELASLILLAGRPDFDAAATTIARDRYALAAIWIGHCTFLMECHGLTILTDPVWSPRLGPLGPKRLVPPPCEVGDLPSVIHFALLSSACYDHYDKNAIAALSSRVLKWFVPLGLKALLTALNVPVERIVELDWWQEHEEFFPSHTPSPSTSSSAVTPERPDLSKKGTETTAESMNSKTQTTKINRATSTSSSSSASKTQPSSAQPQPNHSEDEKPKGEQQKMATNTKPTTLAATSSLSPSSSSGKPATSDSGSNHSHNNTKCTNSNGNTITTTTNIDAKEKPAKTTQSTPPKQPTNRSSKTPAYRIICTPSQHYSVREGTLWCSWAVHTPNHRFFYCGGTGYRSVDKDIDDADTFDGRARFGRPSCPAFRDIGRRVGPFDTAFLPIGGYRPRTLMSGVQGDATDMLFVHRDVRARRSVAHRWGTYASSDEGLLDPIRQLEFALQTGPVHEQDFTYLKHGRLHVS